MSNFPKNLTRNVAALFQQGLKFLPGDAPKTVVLELRGAYPIARPANPLPIPIQLPGQKKITTLEDLRDQLERRRLDTSWVDASCAPERQPGIRQSYQTGFQAGIEQAPIVVQGVGQSGGVISVSEHCTFSSDCGDGRTCRGNQCMGNGYAGDACWFSSDCVSDSCNSRVCR